MTSTTRASGSPGSEPTATITTSAACVLDNTEVAGGLYRLCLSLPVGWGPVRPGQYVSITLEPPWDDSRPGEGGLALLRRPFSVAGWRALEAETIVELIYANVGKVTREIVALSRGESVNVLGPAGTAFPLAAGGAQHVLVGGGRGIAPMLLLARDLRAAREPHALVYGTRTRAEWLPLGELEERTRFATEDGTGGVHGTVIDALDALGDLAPSGPAVVAGCGPHRMLEAIAHWARRRGWPCWVSVEEVFGCSAGLCGGCAIPTHVPHGPYERFLWACRDGAVVAAERIDWDAWRGMHA
jgi:dihydroorotate dehydrogenase electron transfer subunit